jgi:hypothetical protein
MIFTNIIYYKNTLLFAREMDKQDEPAGFKRQFYFPQHNRKGAIYF